MKNFSTWMLVIFMIMFWIFRIMVALAGELNWDFGGITPLNSTMEIVLLFVALASIALVIKRKMVGGLIYLLGYGLYFGADVVNNIQVLISAMSGDVNLKAGINMFISIMGIALAVAVLLDLLMDKSRVNNPKDKKTDWFYTNEQYDRKLDDRADKNNYRTL